MGFDNGLDDESLLIASVNRALRDLYNNRRIDKTVELFNHGITPILYEKKISLKNGDMRVFEIPGHSYSMKVHGAGQYIISNNETFNVYNVDSINDAKLIKGLIAKNSFITFMSNLSLTVYDFSVYDEILSNDPKDVPDGGPTKTINVGEIYGDFVSFSAPPKDRNGRVLENCTLHGDKITIPSDYKGGISITYRYLPKTVQGATGEQIDIPPQYTHFFPLLVAYYFWIGKDEDLALEYKKRYDECIAILDATTYVNLDTVYVDTNGWA